jgi:Competence protein CoiA-like family
MCRRCNGEVIAKCGTHRVAHWAHRGMRDCDTWAEKETDWHRAWKNNFPAECQEFIQHDEQSGEKHIADVRTVGRKNLSCSSAVNVVYPSERRFGGDFCACLPRELPCFAAWRDLAQRTVRSPAIEIGDVRG